MLERCLPRKLTAKTGTDFVLLYNSFNQSQNYLITTNSSSKRKEY